MKLKILMIFTLIANCTPQKSTITRTDTGPKSCSDRTNLTECVLDGECTAVYGDDSATADEILMACVRVGAPNSECRGPKACYTNSAGQRAIASTCDYPRWTEVVCNAAELDPCKYTTATECEVDRRCSLYTAKDLATKQYIAIGCGYIKRGCGAALSCFENKLTGSRVLANSLCETFPEWEYNDCTEADYKASKVP